MLGEIIRQERERRDLTQGDLAVRAGLTQSYVSKLEKGKAPRPSWPVLRRLAAALEIDAALLVHAETGEGQAAGPDSAGSEETFVREMIALAPHLAPADRTALTGLARTLATRRPHHIHEDPPPYTPGD